MEVITLNSVLFSRAVGPYHTHDASGAGAEANLIQHNHSATPPLSIPRRLEGQEPILILWLSWLSQCLHDGFGVVPHQVEIGPGRTLRLTQGARIQTANQICSGLLGYAPRQPVTVGLFGEHGWRIFVFDSLDEA